MGQHSLACTDSSIPDADAPADGAGSYERPAYFEIANLEILRIVERLPRNLRVLDVGCGSGVHGAELKRKYQHSVTGVDLSKASIEKARARIDVACVSDVEQPWAYPFAASTKFDVIVFSDILEHLYDPAQVLRAHLALLKPGGCVVISIPNVAIWNVRLELLFGRFRYQQTGTLDRTHIRFFDRRSYRELISGVGLHVERFRVTPGLLRPFVPLIKRFYGRNSQGSQDANSSCIMDSKAYRLYCQFAYPAERLLCSIWPGLCSFQFVSLCRRN
jgi:SAM-dependent methyltransferase